MFPQRRRPITLQLADLPVCWGWCCGIGSWVLSSRRTSLRDLPSATPRRQLRCRFMVPRVAATSKVHHLRIHGCALLPSTLFGELPTEHFLLFGELELLVLQLLSPLPAIASNPGGRGPQRAPKFLQLGFDMSQLQGLHSTLQVLLLGGRKLGTGGPWQQRHPMVANSLQDVARCAIPHGQLKERTLQEFPQLWGP